MITFIEWMTAQEAVQRQIDPFSPVGAGARRLYISRLPHPNIEPLEQAKQQIARGDVNGALESIQKTLEYYTSQGVSGDQHPEYKMLDHAQDYISKHPYAKAVNLQLLDIAIKQLQGNLPAK